MTMRRFAGLGLALGLALLWLPARAAENPYLSSRDLAVMKGILRSALEQKEQESRTLTEQGAQDHLPAIEEPDQITPEQELPPRFPDHTSEFLERQRLQYQYPPQPGPEPWPGEGLSPRDPPPLPEPEQSQQPYPNRPAQGWGGTLQDREWRERNLQPPPGTPGGASGFESPFQGRERGFQPLPRRDPGLDPRGYGFPGQERLQAPPPSLQPRRDGLRDPRFIPEQPGPRRFAPTPDFNGGGSPFEPRGSHPGNLQRQERRR